MDTSDHTQLQWIDDSNGAMQVKEGSPDILINYKYELNMNCIALHGTASSGCSKTAVWFGTLGLMFKSVPCLWIRWPILC